MSLLPYEEVIEECPRCGHLAPILSAPYPRLTEAIAARPGVLAAADHAPGARRCLAVANLFTDADPREEGKWALRAAWFDEAAGAGEGARSVRLRAAACLEEASHEGYALAPVRLATGLILSETFRLGGDFGRALEHAVRGLRFSNTSAKRERAALVYELDCVLERRVGPLTLASALAGVRALTPDRRRELARTVDVAQVGLSPVTLRPRRTFRHPSLRTYQTLSKEAVVFAQDYMDADLMIQLLRDGRRGVWEAVCLRPELLPALLRACDHDDACVRTHALSTLTERTFSFEPGMLTEHVDAVDALLRRMGDEDATPVRSAASVARALIDFDASSAPRVAAAARAALPRWTKDLSTTGALERLLERADATR